MLEEVIALTGKFGCGKGTVARILKEKYGFKDEVYSNLIIEEAASERKTLSGVREMQDYGNYMRARYGGGILTQRLLEKASHEGGKWVLDGLRNTAEAKLVRDVGGIVVAVDAEAEQRYRLSMIRGRERDPKTWEEFVELDERASGKGQDDNGQQVERCMNEADYWVYNYGDLEDLEAEVERMVMWRAEGKEGKLPKIARR